jgi:hypothetical protein
MPRPVAVSVMRTVRMMPSRSAEPQTNFPVAPPAKVTANASHIRSMLAPFPSRRNGRQVRKTVREPISMPWIVESSEKPRASRIPHPVPVRSAGEGVWGPPRSPTSGARRKKMPTAAARTTSPVP